MSRIGPGFFAAARSRTPAVAVVTWNPSDKDSNITLSDSNMVATRGAGDSLKSVRATRGIAHTDSGYFEVALAGWDHNSPLMVIGIGTASASLASYPGGDANGWGFYQDTGQKYTNATASAYSSAYTSTDVIMVAFKNGSVWFGKNGTWVGDPVAGTGAAFTGITGTIYPMVGLYRGSTPAHAVRGHFGTGEFAYDVPAGFSAWGGAVSVTDPYLANTALILPFTGTAGSTSVTDYSPNANPMTCQSNAAIYTTASRWGRGSMRFISTGDCVTTPYNVATGCFDVGPGEWTLETWISVLGTQETFARIFQTRNGDVVAGISWLFNTALGNEDTYLNLSGNGTTHYFGVNQGNLTGQNVFRHMCLQRIGNTIYSHLNGQLLGSNSTGANGIWIDPSYTMVIGGQTLGASRSMNGLLNDFRFTKGVARYGSGSYFFQPTRPLPLS